MTTPAASMNKTAANMQGTYESAKKTEASYEGQFKAENAAFIAQVTAVFENKMANLRGEFDTKLAEVKNENTSLKRKLVEVESRLTAKHQELKNAFIKHNHVFQPKETNHNHIAITGEAGHYVEEHYQTRINGRLIGVHFNSKMNLSSDESK